MKDDQSEPSQIEGPTIRCRRRRFAPDALGTSRRRPCDTRGRSAIDGRWAAAQLRRQSNRRRQPPRSNLIWGYLLHLSYNMWCDRHGRTIAGHEQGADRG